MPKGSNVVKTNVYLEHPEISFPIPVELPAECCDKCSHLSRSPPPNLHPELKNKLDYHKYTALTYEGQSVQKQDEAQKFLQDFGILQPTPMGNGVSSIRKSSVDGEVIQKIQRTSKHIEIKRQSIADHEDYEYLKSIVAKLKFEILELEGKYEATHTELVDVKTHLNNKEAQVLKLQREVHKLKVIQNILYCNSILCNKSRK